MYKNYELCISAFLGNLTRQRLGSKKFHLGRSDGPTVTFSRTQEPQDPSGWQPEEYLLTRMLWLSYGSMPSCRATTHRGELAFVDETQNWHTDYLWPAKVVWHFPLKRKERKKEKKSVCPIQHQISTHCRLLREQRSVLVKLIMCQ